MHAVNGKRHPRRASGALSVAEQQGGCFCLRLHPPWPAPCGERQHCIVCSIGCMRCTYRKPSRNPTTGRCSPCRRAVRAWRASYLARRRREAEEQAYREEQEVQRWVLLLLCTRLRYPYPQRGRQGSRSVARAGAPLQPLSRLLDKKPLACIAWLAFDQHSSDVCATLSRLQGRRGVGCNPALPLARPGHWLPQQRGRGVPPVPTGGAGGRPSRSGSG